MRYWPLTRLSGRPTGLPCGYPLWRCGAGLDLAVEAGAAPVVLLRQTPFYHADGTPRCRARLQSPYGLPLPCPESTSRSPCVVHFREFFFALASRRLYMTPPDLRGFRPPSTPPAIGGRRSNRNISPRCSRIECIAARLPSQIGTSGWSGGAGSDWQDCLSGLRTCRFPPRVPGRRTSVPSRSGDDDDSPRRLDHGNSRGLATPLTGQYRDLCKGRV